MFSGKEAAPDARARGPQPPLPVKRALALPQELACIPSSSMADVLHLAHMGQLGVLHLTLLLAWLDSDATLMLDFFETSTMSVEVMRVFAMAVGTLAAFTVSGISQAMTVRVGTDEWPGATLAEVRHAARTASNLSKDASTQVQLVYCQGRCMASATHHVALFPRKLPSPKASQEVPSGDDGGSSNGGNSDGFPDYHQEDFDMKEEESKP